MICADVIAAIDTNNRTTVDVEGSNVSLLLKHY